MIIRLLIVVSLVLSATTSADDNPSPTTIIDNADASEWRAVSDENLMMITLATGIVYLELNPELAPAHVERLRSLASQGFYRGLSMYRFVEGFVAQGGAGDKDTDVPTLKNEFVSHSETTRPLDIVINEDDGYSARSGFINGFAVGQNKQGTQTWQIHCPGALGMARGNGVDSATSEFFVVLGQAPRYLDKNISVFGRLLAGMAHIQQLQRSPKPGQPFNPIVDIQFADQLPAKQRPVIKVMRTDSHSFAALVAARKNRPEAWFVATPDYIDTCAMSVPTIIDG